MNKEIIRLNRIKVEKELYDKDIEYYKNNGIYLEYDKENSNVVYILYIIKNDNIYIPQGDLHRLENIGKNPLKIIEIQIGENISEDDIERLEDDFGRV